MSFFENTLSHFPFIVLDGALGSEVANRGFDVNDELWCAKALYEAPGLIKEIHKDYLNRGADIIVSASYQASVPGFMKKGFSREKAVELIQYSTQLAKEARAELLPSLNLRKRPRPLVASAIGPYGAYLADGSEYRGDYSIGFKELKDFHEERVAILAATQPDLFAIETIPLLEEACAIAEVLKKFPQMSAWLTFSCKDSLHTCAGDSIAECVKTFEDNPQIAAIGLNCTPPEFVRDLIHAMKGCTTKPIVVYPNSGEKYDATTKDWKGPCMSFYSYVKEWYDEGARLIGGCCRTTPDDINGIATLRDVLSY